MSRRTGLIVCSILLAIQQGRCFYCRKLMEGRWNHVHNNTHSAWTVDHVTPRSMKGPGANNVVIACYECNMAKGARDPTADEIHRMEMLHLELKPILKAFQGTWAPGWLDDEGSDDDR